MTISAKIPDQMTKENTKDSLLQTQFLTSLLHPKDPEEPTWKYLPLVLALGFIARAAVALSGDFVLHPDEIMQYLEPAHRLAFGNGISYWEYFYGARSWLVPGAVAGVLKLFDLVGFGEPAWYIGGVKLLFCAISLLIPAGMYFFARRHFSETAARVALLTGAFWYELVAFAHKPMTEFVAVALLMVAFALCFRGPEEKSSEKKAILTGFFAVLAVAVRVQYAPLALLPLGIAFLFARKKMRLVLAVTVVFLAVGIFDAVTWGEGLFHSYLTNLHFNLILGELRAGETPAYQFLLWITLAGSGLSVLFAVAALFDLRRYGFLLMSIAVVVLLHSLQAHKEYRFIFAIIPLWLLIAAGVVAQLMNRTNQARIAAGIAIAVFAVVSLAGILNSLPYQKHVYRSYSGETGIVGFVRNQDPIFAAYRYLARTSGVDAVWYIDRPYFNSPGYYYLHNEIPFYDNFTGRVIAKNLKTISASVTHIVSENPKISIPGYSLEQKFGSVQILRRDENKPPARKWEDYNPIIVGNTVKRIMKQVDPEAQPPPANMGIRFAVREQPDG